MDVMYSVYSAKDDLPIVIYGTIKECANALGITVASFKSCASRQRKGKPRSGITKYIIIREDDEDDGWD